MDNFFASVCAIVLLCVASAQSGVLPPSGFTCQGRVAGYYADIDTGCQVYHMCDGLGRQFSYQCPNTTLFQQRMLICDHWYMVNCSDSENNYNANLLIGQRDKPFVSDEEMKFRTPRPDILSVPPNNNYYDGLKEAESKYSLHQSNSITDDDDLDDDQQTNRKPSHANKVHNRPKHPTSPSKSHVGNNEDDNVNEEASTKAIVKTPNNDSNNVSPPSKDLLPPLSPTTTEASEFDIDVRMKTTDQVIKFIKRFDPNSPDSLNTSMTKNEIIDLNKHLPAGQASAEDERTPRKNKNFGNNANTVQGDKKKGATEDSRSDTANVKSNAEGDDVPSNGVNVPSRELLPPKFDYTPLASTTMGPPIYFEWKWAVPAFDLEPPKLGNVTFTNITETPLTNTQQLRRPFNQPRTTTEAGELKTQNVEYNISSYFVPDYVFPLDNPHPGYEGDNVQTSFQVEVSRPGRSSYGENPNCPQCHPAYVNPGSCEPCIVKR